MVEQDGVEARALLLENDDMGQEDDPEKRKLSNGGKHKRKTRRKPKKSKKTFRRTRSKIQRGGTIGDLVFVGRANPPIIGRIVFHISVQVDELLELVSLVEEFTVTDVQKRCWKCVAADTQTLFNMSDIVCCLTWAGTDVLTVLKPWHALPFPTI